MQTSAHEFAQFVQLMPVMVMNSRAEDEHNTGPSLDNPRSDLSSVEGNRSLKENLRVGVASRDTLFEIPGAVFDFKTQNTETETRKGPLGFSRNPKLKHIDAVPSVLKVS